MLDEEQLHYHILCGPDDCIFQEIFLQDRCLPGELKNKFGYEKFLMGFRLLDNQEFF